MGWYEYIEALDPQSIFWAEPDPQSTCFIWKLVMLVVYFEVLLANFREFVMVLIGIF